jgi:hypothetical protein
MKKLNNTIKGWSIAALSSIVLLSACNKELDTYTPLATPTYPTPSSGLLMGRAVAANPSDSLFYKMMLKSGQLSIFNDSTKTLTLFAVDNAGMKVFANAISGGAIPLTATDSVVAVFINSASFPAASAAGIMQYLTIGQKYLSSAFPVSSPNFPLPTLIQLDPINTPFLRMTTCVAKGSPFSYLNNVPITGVDQVVTNGVIHHIFSVSAPPQATLKTLIATKPTLSYFRAAIARADSGVAPGTGRLDSLLNYGVLNMTVLPPVDSAFRNLVFGLAYSSALSAGASPAVALATANGAVAAGPAFLATNNVSTALVKGILAYHFVASGSGATVSPNKRFFSVNVPSTPAFLNTLVNGSVAAHPGIKAQATFTGPVATTVSFTGLGTFPSGGAAFSSPAAVVIDKDNHAVNGVFHIIDRVLLPQ